MKEHNFHISIKYGLTPQLHDFEWQATMTFTDFNDNGEGFVGLCEAFYQTVKTEINRTLEVTTDAITEE